MIGLRGNYRFLPVFRPCASESTAVFHAAYAKSGGSPFRGRVGAMHCLFCCACLGIAAAFLTGAAQEKRTLTAKCEPAAVFAFPGADAFRKGGNIIPDQLIQGTLIIHILKKAAPAQAGVFAVHVYFRVMAHTEQAGSVSSTVPSGSVFMFSSLRIWTGDASKSL